ncbi:ArsB/NhaD family transporter [Clostridium cylindrosporum]|uniref:Arsenical pump membrane protein ArsB n=1 Tax=Clostridium cylindrosporum DSM 605 TaxID=1121307 RepID=A0A0J8DFS8_CLOCY|nr:ArsB/NhaD family transporter [Clostridium cylindrosporum]KMT23094.1 arsenical pump membrane protein ArsB [Clostridium cylindrosporum DSM 605]
MERFFFSAFIFLLTITCIFLKPFNKKEWVYTTFFAMLTLLFGLVKFHDIEYVFSNVWNAALSLISIMIISLVLDDIGFFKWSALTMVLTSEGNKFKLFLNLIILGSLISVFFNNDGAILILTPIIYEAMKSLGLTYRETIPFLFACGYIADTASVPLVVSNLANIVAADTLSIDFTYYLSKMIIPGIVIIVSVSVTMFINYRKELTGYYKTTNIINPDDCVKDWSIFNSGIFTLLLVIVGYFIGGLYRIPVSIISTLGALFLLAQGYRRKTVKINGILKKAPWSILIFVLSMYLIVYGLYINGLNVVMYNIMQFLNNKSVLVVSLLYGIISTIAACFMNNLPSVMVGSIAVNDSLLNGVTREIISFANVIGSDVGAKITPIGSLATIMWIGILSQRGIKISFKEYTITSLKIIVPPLLIGLIVLAIM